MEKVNELIKQLIKVCNENEVAVTIATTNKDCETSTQHSGARKGIFSNVEGVMQATAELILKEKAGCDCPICKSVKQPLEAMMNSRQQDKEERHVHFAEIGSVEDLDFVLKKIFGGK